jgi:hypothetical protein
MRHGRTLKPTTRITSFFSLAFFGQRLQVSTCFVESTSSCEIRTELSGRLLNDPK